mmetsp:Transcript_29284/g.52671  ORF Transcript_29284/g.52671 Transcript_29284/m.52671 type:complete len:210 (+) Transcript_29284:353-982(+)
MLLPGGLGLGPPGLEVGGPAGHVGEHQQPPAGHHPDADDHRHHCPLNDTKGADEHVEKAAAPEVCQELEVVQHLGTAEVAAPDAPAQDQGLPQPLGLSLQEDDHEPKEEGVDVHEVVDRGQGQGKNVDEAKDAAGNRQQAAEDAQHAHSGRALLHVKNELLPPCDCHPGSLLAYLLGVLESLISRCLLSSSHSIGRRVGGCTSFQHHDD